MSDIAKGWGPLAVLSVVNSVIGALVTDAGVVVVIAYWVGWCAPSGFVAGWVGARWEQGARQRREWRKRLDALEQLQEREWARWN